MSWVVSLESSSSTLKCVYNKPCVGENKHPFSYSQLLEYCVSPNKLWRHSEIFLIVSAQSCAGDVFKIIKMSFGAPETDNSS